MLHEQLLLCDSLRSLPSIRSSPSLCSFFAANIVPSQLVAFASLALYTLSLTSFKYPSPVGVLGGEEGAKSRPNADSITFIAMRSTKDVTSLSSEEQGLISLSNCEGVSSEKLCMCGVCLSLLTHNTLTWGFGIGMGFDAALGRGCRALGRACAAEFSCI